MKRLFILFLQSAFWVQKISLGYMKVTIPQIKKCTHRFSLIVASAVCVNKRYPLQYLANNSVILFKLILLYSA